MKFALANLLVVVSLAGCAGCGSSDEDSTKTDNHEPSSAQTNPQQPHQDQNTQAENSSGTGGVPGDSHLTSHSTSVTQPTATQGSSTAFAARASNIETAEFTLDDLDCGGNPVKVDVKVYRPKNGEDDDRYVLLVGDHTGRTFFEGIDRNANELVNVLSNKNRVIQIGYPNRQKCGDEIENGLVTACCKKGMHAVIKHNENLINRILEISGYNHSTNSKKKLSAIGFGLGTLQLSTMAFYSGVKFDHLALISPVLGDVEDGCKDMTWITEKKVEYDLVPNQILNFSKLYQLVNLGAVLDSLSANGRGCTKDHGHHSEYNSSLNIDQFPHFRHFSGEMAVFEGKSNYDISELERFPGSIGSYATNMVLAAGAAGITKQMVGHGAAAAGGAGTGNAIQQHPYTVGALTLVAIQTGKYIWYNARRSASNYLGKKFGGWAASGFGYQPGRYIYSKMPEDSKLRVHYEPDLYSECNDENIWECKDGFTLSYNLMHFFRDYVDANILQQEQERVELHLKKRRPVKRKISGHANSEHNL